MNPLKRSRPEPEAISELNKWWDKEENFDKMDKNEPKWEYLEHNGVQFPAFYKPHKVRINHKGEPISLNKDEEELATYWSQTIGSEWEQKPIYRANFFIFCHVWEMGRWKQWNCERAMAS